MHVFLDNHVNIILMQKQLLAGTGHISATLSLGQDQYCLGFQVKQGCVKGHDFSVSINSRCYNTTTTLLGISEGKIVERIASTPTFLPDTFLTQLTAELD